MKKIRKAVIPAAGFGTRFLPATKAQPKEMLPVVDKPIIQYVVEELVASGIEDIVIVTGGSKRAIEDHFDYNYELQHHLKKSGKEDIRQEVKRIADMANFVYIRQKGPYGNGTPVLNAKDVIGNEPFVVVWGDEFIYADPPRVSQMIQVYEKYNGMVLSGMRVAEDAISRYGIADISPVEGSVFEIKNIVEKPAPAEAPSDLALLGAYILPPEIFHELENLEPGKGNEIWLVEAINNLKAKDVPLYACEVQNGKYYDCGNKLEYIKTNIEFALKNPDMKDELKEFLKLKIN